MIPDDNINYLTYEQVTSDLTKAWGKQAKMMDLLESVWAERIVR